jgi:glycosyltransferase involved in cell wall biosynthesis
MFRNRRKTVEKPAVQGPAFQAAKTKPLPQRRIGVIIPAYNEAEGIEGVLKVLSQVDLLAEILVVDDGSTDETASIVTRCTAQDDRLRLVRHKHNRGKGEAIFTGWGLTRSTIIVTLDADLIGLTPEQVGDLIRPVLEKRADMTLGLFEHGNWRTDKGHQATPWLTGQRCFRASLLRLVSRPAAAGYGFETALTVAARQHGWRIQRVPLTGVYHPPSEAHRGLWLGFYTRVQMYAQILRAWYLASDFPGKVARLMQWDSYQ